MMRISTAYMPPLEWFKAFAPDTAVEIEACEHYQKGGWRNRCLIAGPNGTQLLSIPLEKGKHQQTPIRDVRIAYSDNWQLRHWRTIQTAYGNAPFFEYYGDELREILVKKESFLFDYNLKLLHFFLKKLQWKGEVLFSAAYHPLPAPALVPVQPYPQVFQDRHGFTEGLSVLDGLMCAGKGILNQ